MAVTRQQGQDSIESLLIPPPDSVRVAGPPSGRAFVARISGPHRDMAAEVEEKRNELRDMLGL